MGVKMKKFIQKDIAEILNISRATVSRALDGSALVKKETRDKVIALSKELGYEVNPMAKNLAKKGKYVVRAYLIDQIEEDYLSRIKSGINKALDKNDQFQLEIEYVITKTIEPEKQIMALERDCDRFSEIDALLIMPIEEKDISEFIKEKKVCEQVPVFILGFDIEKPLRKGFVGCDHLQSGRIVANIFNEISRLNEEILIVKPNEYYTSSEQRIEGFFEAINNADRARILKSPIKLDTDISKKIKALNIKYIYSQVHSYTLARAIKNLNVKIIAHDYGEHVKTAMQKGYITCIVYNNPYIQGYVIIERIIDYIILGKHLETDMQYIKNDIILKHNMNDTYWV